MSDLGDVRAGQVLRFASGVELEVTGQSNPCKNLAVYQPQAPKELYGRRGLLTVVRNPGSVRPGDTVKMV
jgi:MOSC domain-containing protein YiiM